MELIAQPGSLIMRLHLQVQVLLLLAIHTIVRGQPCQVTSTQGEVKDGQVIFPSGIIYQSSIIINNAEVGANCTSSSIGGQQYSNCSLPNVLVNRDAGPQQFRLADPASYYSWNIQEATQMLFTFSTDVRFIGMNLYFYFSDTNGTGLPRARVYFVNNSYPVENVPSMDNFPSLPIDPDFPSSTPPVGTEPVDVLLSKTTDFTVLSSESTTTSGILFTLSTHKRFSLPLSEVQFCKVSSVTTTAASTGTASTGTASTGAASTSTEQTNPSSPTSAPFTGSEPTTRPRVDEIFICTSSVDGQASHRGISMMWILLFFVLSVLFLHL